MFTPQEIQEKTFTKAVFGGYDMQTVDDFLEPLTEDYITLYKENAVLKSKMKVLVEKLEEYRSQEQSMRKAILSAQRTADAMVAEAEKKCARLMHEAAGSVQVRSGRGRRRHRPGAGARQLRQKKPPRALSRSWSGISAATWSCSNP